MFFGDKPVSFDPDGWPIGKDGERMVMRTRGTSATSGLSNTGHPNATGVFGSTTHHSSSTYYITLTRARRQRTIGILFSLFVLLPLFLFIFSAFVFPDQLSAFLTPIVEYAQAAGWLPVE